MHAGSLRIVRSVYGDNNTKHTCAAESEYPKILPGLLLSGLTFRKMLLSSAIRAKKSASQEISAICKIGGGHEQRLSYRFVEEFAGRRLE